MLKAKKSASYWIVAVSLIFSYLNIRAQEKTTTYDVKQSAEMEVPKKHELLSTYYYQNGIIQTSNDEVLSFTFRQFSQDLKLLKENTVNTEGKLNPDVNRVLRLFKFKNKTYLFTRDLNKKEKKEGVSAWEFSFEKLDFIGSPTNLFQTSDRITYAPPGKGGIMNFEEHRLRFDPQGYNFCVSADESKFLYTYSLAPKEKKDALNKAVIGMYVFDENLEKKWGGEFQMPYNEAIMGYVNYTVANDGSVYMLNKIYDSENDKKDEKRDSEVTYHYEVFIYKAGSTTPVVIQIPKQANFLQAMESRIFEMAPNKMVIAGIYGKEKLQRLDILQYLYAEEKPAAGGVYVFNIDVQAKTVSTTNGYYELGTIQNYSLKKLHTAENGSLKMIIEQNTVTSSVTNNKTSYEYTCGPLQIVSIDAKGKMEWKKVDNKHQFSFNSKFDETFSIKSFIEGNDVYIVYINHDFKPAKGPKGDYLTALKIDAKGTLTSTDVQTLKDELKIRYFVKGNNGQLIGSTDRKNISKVFTIGIKK